MTREGPWYRCVDDDHAQPWWFSARDTTPDPGRFDLRAPRGTCYLAENPAGAIIERVAEPDADDPAPVTVDALSALRIWSGQLDDGSGLADTTVASVPRLTGELATIVPYDLPHAWVDALDGSGASGILYRARFASVSAVGLFGPAGAPEPDDTDDPRHRGTFRRAPATAFLADLPPAFRGDAVDGIDGFVRGPAPPR
jgi:hypothetical protein